MEFENLGFGTLYQVRLLDHELSRIPNYYFKFSRKTIEMGSLAFETQTRDENGPILEIATSNGNTWTGTFEPGPEGLTGIFATPSLNALVVVIQGQGFWIPTLHPDSYEIIDVVPIKQVIRVPDRDIILFVDFARIAAYGPNGLIWRSNELSWDGLQITEVTDQLIRGLGWDSPEDLHVEFEIDISTGITSGGSSPSHYSAKHE